MAMALVLRDTTDRLLELPGWSVHFTPGDMAQLRDAHGVTRAATFWPVDRFHPQLLDKLTTLLPASEWRWLSTR